MSGFVDRLVLPALTAGDREVRSKVDLVVSGPVDG